MSSAKGKRSGDASCAGRSLIEILWDAMMDAYADLVKAAEQKQFYDNELQRNESDVYLSEKASDCSEDLFLKKGECLGLARAIAIFTNPYQPDVDAVREEAAARWETMSST